jgi:hypothetical protein
MPAAPLGLGGPAERVHDRVLCSLDVGDRLYVALGPGALGLGQAPLVSLGVGGEAGSELAVKPVTRGDQLTGGSNQRDNVLITEAPPVTRGTAPRFMRACFGSRRQRRRLSRPRP